MVIEPMHFQWPRGRFARRTLQTVIFSSFMLWGICSGNPVHAQPPAQAKPKEDAATASVMIARGDSLQAAGKWVAALSMYKGAQQRTYDPCLTSPAAAGIAEVHLKSLNYHEARWSTESAAEFAAQCGHPHELILRISDLWIGLNEDIAARDLIDAALEAHPHPALWSEKVLLAQLSGHPESILRAFKTWASGDGERDTPLRVAQVRGVVLQAQIMRDTVWHAHEERAFEEALAAISPLEECALREQVYLVLKAKGQVLNALQWARIIRDKTPTDDLAGLTLAELRIAHCARDAHRPLDALIAYHEAERAARKTGDRTLLAETLRQVASFETDRGHHRAALAAWSQVDSLQQLMLAQLTPANIRNRRDFSTFVSPIADAFDQAAEDHLAAFSATSRSVDLRSNPWVWVAVIGWIGLLSFAMKNRALHRIVQRERQRLVTLRQWIHANPSLDVPASEGENINLRELSLVPKIHGEPVESIESILQSLDEAIDHPIEFEILSLRPILLPLSMGRKIRPLVRELLKLQTHSEIFGSAPIHIQVIDREREWQIRLNGPRISTAPSLRALFQPLPNLQTSESGMWLRSAMRDLAAQLTVERSEGHSESWVFTMPNLQA